MEKAASQTNGSIGRRRRPRRIKWGSDGKSDCYPGDYNEGWDASRTDDSDASSPTGVAFLDLEQTFYYWSANTGAGPISDASNEKPWPPLFCSDLRRAATLCAVVAE